MKTEGEEEYEKERRKRRMKRELNMQYIFGAEATKKF